MTDIQHSVTQRDLDRLTFDMFVDLSHPFDSAAETRRIVAREMGIDVRTVRARVRRHSIRLSEEARS